MGPDPRADVCGASLRRLVGVELATYKDCRRSSCHLRSRSAFADQNLRWMHYRRQSLGQRTP